MICIVIHWLNTVLWTEKNMLPSFVLIKEIGNRYQDCQKNDQLVFANPFSVAINTLSANSQIEGIECIECIQLKNLIMSLYQTFISSLLPEQNIPHFTITPCSCHSFLAVCTFVNSCQGWSTGRVKFHKKSVKNTWDLTTNCNHCHQTRQMH